MKQSVILLLLAMCAFGASAQNILKGYVLDAATLEPLPYVNVGVVGQALGTVTNEAGEFYLNIPDAYNSDSLRVSMIGYGAVSYQVANLKMGINSTTIKLTATDYEIKAVEVNSTKLKNKIVGSTSSSMVMAAGFTTNDLGNEVCVKINMKKGPYFLNNFNFHIARNTCDTVTFRVNIYNLKNDLPNESLLYENLIVTTTKTSGWVTIDLRPYALWLEEDFAIGVEYIKPCPEKSLFFSGAFLGSIYSRTTSQADWETLKGFDLGFNVEVLR